MNPNVNPQGTLAQLDPANPLVTAAAGVDRPGTATPSGTDTAQSPTGSPLPGMGTTRQSPNGGATMAERFPGFQSQWNQKFTTGTQQAMKAGISPLAAAVAGAIHANNPTSEPVPQAPTRPEQAATGVASGIHSLTSSLGDAGAVGTVSPGGGALQGLSRTFGARNEREQKEQMQQSEIQKNRTQMAEANVRMMHEQRLVSKLDEETKQGSVDSGLKQIQFYRSLPSPGIIKGQNLTSDQLTELINKGEVNDPASKTIDPTKETAIPDGLKVVGEDKNGNPIKRMTYSVVRPPEDVTLNKDYPGAKEVLAELNKYAPPANGGKWSEGQNFTGAQFNLAMQHAADVRAVTSAVKQSLIQNKVMDQKQAQDIEAINLRETPDLVNALSHTPTGDIMQARSVLLGMKNPDGTAKYPNLDYDLKQAIPDYDKLLDNHQKRLDDQMTNAMEFQKELDRADGEKAASMAQGIQAKLDDPNTLETMKPRLRSQLKQANAQAEASLKYSADKKAKEAEAESKANEGDLSTLQDMVLKYEYEPDKLFSRFKGLKQKQEFLAKIHQIDPTWSEATYRAKYNTTNDFRPEGKGGQEVRSLNTFAGHTGDANSLITQLQNTRSPLLNEPINKWKQGVMGENQIIEYKQAITAAADEYISFLLSQKAKHQSDDDLVKKLTDENASPAMQQGILRQMTNTMAIRGRSLNKSYRDTMGHDIPNYLDADTQQVLRTFGIDPNSLVKQGTSGLIQTPNQGSPMKLPPAPQGTVRIKTPGGTIMDIPQNQQDQATANGAIVVTEQH